jgi:hypothetical protein
MSLRDYVVSAYLRPVLCAVPVAAIAYEFSKLQTTSWLAFAAEAMSMVLLCGVMSYFLVLYADQRAAVTARLWGLFRQTPAANV